MDEKRYQGDEENVVPEVIFVNEEELANFQNANQEEEANFWNTASVQELTDFIESGDDFDDVGREEQFFKCGTDEIVTRYLLARISKKRKLNKCAIKRILKLDREVINWCLYAKEYFEDGLFCRTLIKLDENTIKQHAQSDLFAKFIRVGIAKHVETLLNKYLQYNICLPKVAEYRLARSLDIDFAKAYINACIKKGINLDDVMPYILCLNNSQRKKAFVQTWIQAGKTLDPTQQRVFTEFEHHSGKKLFFQNLVNGTEMSSTKRVTEWLFSLNDDKFVIECISQNQKNGYIGSENIAKLLFLVSTNNEMSREFHKEKREQLKKELWG